MRQKAVMIVEPPGSYATVTGAIRQAARMTGADFKYLLATAQVESNLIPMPGLRRRRAGVVPIHRADLAHHREGVGDGVWLWPYANAISRQPAGDYAVADQRMTKAVMNLRSDPTANALMAGPLPRPMPESSPVSSAAARPRANSTSRISWAPPERAA